MEQPVTPGEPPQEESIFQEDEFSMKGYDKHIKNARIMLFVMAGLQLIGVYTALALPDPARWITIVIYLFFGGVFAGLAFWTHQKPYTALLTALIIYVSLQVFGGIYDPSSIYRGIVLKIGIIVMLIIGMRNGKDAQDMKEAFGKNH
jgi:prepilin signal peptidase PulO-like enzyme (type II secretory pathway)